MSKKSRARQSSMMDDSRKVKLPKWFTSNHPALPPRMPITYKNGRYRVGTRDFATLIETYNYAHDNNLNYEMSFSAVNQGKRTGEGHGERECYFVRTTGRGRHVLSSHPAQWSYALDCSLLRDAIAYTARSSKKKFSTLHDALTFIQTHPAMWTLYRSASGKNIWRGDVVFFERKAQHRLDEDGTHTITIYPRSQDDVTTSTTEGLSATGATFKDAAINLANLVERTYTPYGVLRKR